MTGMWRGFLMTKKKLLLTTKFPKLTHKDQIPLDLHRSSIVNLRKLREQNPKLLPEQIIPLEIQRDPNCGLHGGKEPMAGFYVTRTNKKMKRLWRPHILVKSLYSELLDYTFTIPVSTHVIREIDRLGSLDAYVLYTRPNKLGGIFAVDFHNKLLDVIENDLDAVVPPKIKRFPKPPEKLLEVVAKSMDEAKAKAIEENTAPEKLVEFDYSSMAT